MDSDRDTPEPEPFFNPINLCNIGALLGEYAASDLFSRQPFHTSALKGTEYTKELLSGNANWLRRMLGVTHIVFYALKQHLVDGGFIYDRYKVKVDEQLAIFLYIVRHGASVVLAGDRFSRGGDTISRYVNHSPPPPSLYHPLCY